jgi:hypothetical protein
MQCITLPPPVREGETDIERERQRDKERDSIHLNEKKKNTELCIGSLTGPTKRNPAKIRHALFQAGRKLKL